MAWNLARIESLVNSGIEESDELEFKRCAAISRPLTEKQRKELSKDVSAFANYPGGAIVFGIIEETIDAGGRKVKRVKGLDGGYEQGEIDRAWLEDVLPHLVTHPLMRFNVASIPIGNGKSIYVLEIPRSPIAPHQASDHCYYGRKGARSIPLSHLELEAVRHLGNPAQLGVSFDLGPVSGSIESGMFKPRRIEISVNLRNTGFSIVRGIFLEVFVPAIPGIQVRSSANKDSITHKIGDIEYRKFFHFLVTPQGAEVKLYPDQESIVPSIVVIEPTNKDRGIRAKDIADAQVRWRVHTEAGFRQEGSMPIKPLYDAATLRR
jgi:hypothetical protein